MKLPQTHTLTPDEVRQAFGEWVTNHRLGPHEPYTIVQTTIAWHIDGSVTATFDHPPPAKQDLQ